MDISDLPVLNASLNATATLFIVAGVVCIKSDRKQAHIACMATALTASAAFLISYLIYHFTKGEPTPFGGTGAIRVVYYVMLISHILLAMVNLPMIIVTVVPALRGRFDRHKRLARWTWPVWLYVSVTGILVYFFLYVWFPVPLGS